MEIMNQETTTELISSFLIKEWGFKKYYTPFHERDFDKTSCTLRLHELHYLLWSEDWKYFSLRVRHDKHKGKPAGGVEYYHDTIIPKVIYTIEDAVKLLEGIIDKRTTRLYN